MPYHPPGKVTEIPAETLTKIRELSKQKGAIAALCRKAGLTDTLLYPVALHGKSRMNETYLGRVEKALKGEASPPIEPAVNQQAKRGRPAKGRGGRRKALVKAEPTTAAILQTLTSQPITNGREAGLRSMLDGLALGVEITRRSVFEYLGQKPAHH